MEIKPTKCSECLCCHEFLHYFDNPADMDDAECRHPNAGGAIIRSTELPPADCPLRSEPLIMRVGAQPGAWRQGMNRKEVEPVPAAAWHMPPGHEPVRLRHADGTETVRAWREGCLANCLLIPDDKGVRTYQDSNHESWPPTYVEQPSMYRNVDWAAVEAGNRERVMRIVGKILEPTED